MKSLALLSLLPVLAGCVQPTAPASRAPEIASPGRSSEAGPGLRHVRVLDSGDSLIFRAEATADPRGLAVSLWLDTDQNDDTGGPYRGGPDYIAGDSGVPWPTLARVTSRFPFTWESCGRASGGFHGRELRLAVAWADLDRAPGALDWTLHLYGGRFFLGRYDGTFAPITARGW